MPSGQTQKVYGHNEKALAPETIGDIHRMLSGSRATSQIRNHRTVSGVMFFEVSREQWRIKRGYAPYFQYHLVAGEDPEEKGCLVTMHLSHGIRRLDVLHMKSMWDTRAGIPNIAWCSAFQFKRQIYPTGTNSRAYWAIREARRAYCKELLGVFDDSKSLDDQDWHEIQNIIDRHRRLFYDCQCEQCRVRRLAARTGDDDDDDDDNNDRNDYNDRNSHPRPGRSNNDTDDADDDDDNNSGNQRNWQHELSLLRRRRSLDSTAENHEDLLDDGQNAADVEEDTNAELDMEDDINEDFDMDVDPINNDEILFGDRSQSPFRFVPHSRDPSPDMDAYSATENDNVDDTPDIDDEFVFDMDVDGMTTHPSPTRPASPIHPKLEPKVEHETDLMTYTEHTRQRQTHDLIDLTEEDDESIKSWNNAMEVIELAEDSDTIAERSGANNRYDAMIDLTQESEGYQSGSDMQVIEIDD